MRSVTVTLTHTPPREIIAGDSIEFLVAIPSDLTGFTGSARLTGPSGPTGPASMDATSVATEGTDLHIKFSGQATTGTKDLTPGPYTLGVWLTSGTDRYTILTAPITIAADLAIGNPALSHALQMLDHIERAIRARVTGTVDGGIEGYEIDGMRVDKLSLLDLEKLRSTYSGEVNRLRGGGNIGSLAAVFTNYGDLSGMRARSFWP